MSRKRLGLWFSVCSVAIGVATTVAGVAMTIAGETPDSHSARLGESLLLSLSVIQVGPHNFIAIGFALAMNVVIIAAICWMTLWLCSVTLMLLQRLRKTL